jgi:FkbM family methyltransferase
VAITSLVNDALLRAGLEVRRKPDGLIRSADEISMTLEYVAAHFACRHPDKDVTLMGIGAFDGASNDPAVEVMALHGWSGVLVEPQREPFKALAKLYENRPGVQVFNVAIAEEDSLRTLFMIEPSPELPTWTQEIASFDKAHVLKANGYLPRHVKVEDRIVEQPVECWSFDTLFDRAGITHVDVLQIDAEGYDLELLRCFDIPRRLPAIVNYEHVHLSRDDRNAAASLLIENRYRLGMSFRTENTVAYRDP